MNSEKKYFKTATSGEFVKSSLPIVIPLTVMTFLFLPLSNFIKWIIVGSGSFVLFPSFFDIAFYWIFVASLLLLELREFRNLYHRMQKNPFLVIAEEGMVMDRALLPSRVGSGKNVKIQLGWAEIRRIEAGKDRFVLYFQKKGKEESIKADLKWVRKKEDLIEMLKMKCRQHQITWAEKEI